MNRHPFCLRCGSDISTCVCPEDLRAYPVIQRLEAENAQLKQQIAKLEAESAILDGFVEQRDLKLSEAEAKLQSKDAELQAILTAVTIMCDQEPGAAANAVREDYPELAKVIDGAFAGLGAELQALHVSYSGAAAHLANEKRLAAELQDCQKQLLDRVDASNAHDMKLKCDLLLKEAEIQLPENQRILEIRRVETELSASEERLKIAVEALQWVSDLAPYGTTVLVAAKSALDRIAEKR